MLIDNWGILGLKMEILEVRMKNEKEKQVKWFWSGE
jgi:hypothetical protein